MGEKRERKVLKHPENISEKMSSNRTTAAGPGRQGAAARGRTSGGGFLSHTSVTLEFGAMGMYHLFLNECFLVFPKTAIGISYTP